MAEGDAIAFPSFEDTAPALDWDSDEEQGSRPSGAKKGIKSASSKQKGRRLQQWCAAKYLEGFAGYLDAGDVVSRPMGSAGEDLMLSPKAREVLPYDFEAKNTEKFSVWASLEQSAARAKDNLVTCVIAKRNRIQPIVIIPWGDFLNLVRISSTGRREPAVTHVSATIRSFLSSLRIPLRDKPFLDMANVAKESLQFAALISEEEEKEKQPQLDDGESTLVWETYHIKMVCSKKIGFYELWDTLWDKSGKCKKHTPALLFNRKSCDQAMYIALPFDTHLELLKKRWKVMMF